MKKVYIQDDLVVDLTEEEYNELFSKEERSILSLGEAIVWTDSEGVSHIVKEVIEEPVEEENGR